MSGTPTPPASFLPLDDADGVPGDARALAVLSRRYADTAAEIEAQAAHLERLTSRSQEAWKSEAGDTFVDVAGDLAERILRAKGRYEAAAQALGQFAADLEVVQSEAYDAVRRAQDAEASRRALEMSAPTPPGAGATLEQLLAAADEQRLHDRAVSSAAGDLEVARRAYGHAVEEYHRAAERAARTLGHGSDDDMVDDWWDQNAGWLGTALTVIGAVAFVLAVGALVLTMLLPGLNLLVGGLLLSQVVNGLGLVLLGGHTAMWLSGNGDLSDVLWDLAGVATFGLGFVVGRIARGLVGVASRTGSAIAAGRAGRATFTARGLSSAWYVLGQRLPLSRSVLALSPRMRKAFAAADAAAAARSAQVESITGAQPTLLNRVLALGDRELAELGTWLSRTNAAVPGSARLFLVSGAFRTVEVAGGPLVEHGLLLKSGLDAHQDLVARPAEARRDAIDRPQIVGQWSMPLMQVR